MKKILSLLLLLLAFSCNNESSPETTGGTSSATFDIKILPAARAELAPGESAELSYIITGEVVNPIVSAIAPNQVQVAVIPNADKLGGTINLTLASSVTDEKLQVTILVVAANSTVTKPIDITVKGGGGPVTPPTPGEFIDRRLVRTVKMVEDGTKSSYVWFEYNTQKRVTKATILDNKDNRTTFNYSYPTASSIIATCQEYEMSASFFISEGRLVSVTESGGDRMSFTYDSKGHLTSYNGKTCVWTGEDMTSIQENNHTVNIRPSSRQDNNGVSFLIATSDGDIDDLYTYPVLAPLPGINSAHLPGSVTYQNNFAINFAYEVDSQGCIKTITTDGGQIFYIWYVDEAESADEHPAGDTPPPPAEQIERRPVRTIKLTEHGTKSCYAWFEYNFQNKVTKATLWEKENTTVFNFSYPTQNTIVVNCPEYSMGTTLLLSDGRLASVTESDGDKVTFKYDANGHLASFDDYKCTWTGENMTTMVRGNNESTVIISHTSYKDLNGVSYLMASSSGDIDDLYMYPVLATMPGLNSYNLPSSEVYRYSSNSYTVNFYYGLDSRGYIKTISTGADVDFKIWYTDEAESSEEKPAVDPSDPPSSDILTVSGAQFYAASPSQTQLYRLTGAIDSIVSAEYGDFYIKTADGSNLYIYGANSAAGGYGAANDRTFAARKLRRGDEITMVGYRGVYNGVVQMVYGYVEDSYRLQVSDFVGIYNVVCDRYEFENKLVGWSGTELYYDGEFILFRGMIYNTYEDSSQNWLDNLAVALGYYDDETGTVSLLGSWYNDNFNWYYTDAGENSQHYISIFYPVVFNSTDTDFSWAENVTVGSYSAAGAIVLQPRSELRGSTEFGFERKGSKEESRYVFLDHEYDVEQSQVGNVTYRSAVMQFWYMTRQSTSVSSVRKTGRNGAVRTSAPSPSLAKARSRKNR